MSVSATSLNTVCPCQIIRGADNLMMSHMPIFNVGSLSRMLTQVALRHTIICTSLILQQTVIFPSYQWNREHQHLIQFAPAVLQQAFTMALQHKHHPSPLHNTTYHC